MKGIIYKNLKDLKEYDFNSVIQSNACIGKNYKPCENQIIIEEPKKVFCLYEANELLNELTNAGEYFLKLGIKCYFDFYYHHNEPVHFGYNENSFIIIWNEEQKKKAIDYIQKWCLEKASPCHTIEDSVLLDDITKLNDLKANEIIEINEIEDFVSKCIVICFLNKVYSSIFCIQKNLMLEDLQEEKINIEINKLNRICPRVIKNYHKFNIITFQNNEKDIYALLNQLNEFTDKLCDLMIDWSRKFSTSLSVTAMYNEKEKKYVKIFVSDEITNLAWNHLISIITTINPIQEKNVCAICGEILQIDFLKPGPKITLCEKHRKERNNSTNRDKKNRQFKQRLIDLLNNKNLLDKQKEEIKELLKFSDRRFPVKRYKQLIDTIAN